MNEPATILEAVHYWPRSAFATTSFGLNVPKHLLEKCEKAYERGKKHINRMRLYRQQDNADRSDEIETMALPASEPEAQVWDASLEDSINSYFGSGA